MTRRVCIVTGSRAEYGLLRWVMQGIADTAEMNLQIIATGMHLSPEFGLTYREIEQDGFRIDFKVEMLLSSDTAVGVAKSIGIGILGFADALKELHPDMLVVLGDRFEIFSAVSAALIAKIPVAHLHGGEITEGAFDDALRHAITKMSHLHFVAAEEYRQRVIQLGEQPDRVFMVGGLGIDNIKKLNLLSRSELEASLEVDFGIKNLLVTFHPPTLDSESASEQMKELLAALEGLSDTRLFFTMPNSDTGGRALIKMINDFVGTHSNARAWTSMGQLRYLSCMQYVDAVIGNSSSGLIEAPYFKKGTINIGDRQRGRLKASSVIDCVSDRTSIAAALGKLYSSDFQARLPCVINPYGQGGASERIVSIIRTQLLERLLKKHFFDLPTSACN